MASFTNQVAYLTGDATAYTNEMPVWLADGVKDVVNKVVAMNPEKAKDFSLTLDMASGSATIASDKVFRVYRQAGDGGVYYECPVVENMYKEVVADEGSIYYATAYSPLAIKVDSALTIYPAPTHGAFAYVLTYGAVTDNTPAVANFPSGLYYLVALYAAIRATEARISDVRDQADSYADTDEDSEMNQLMLGQAASLEALRARLTRDYEEGIKGAAA